MAIPGSFPYLYNSNHKQCTNSIVSNICWATHVTLKCQNKEFIFIGYECRVICGSGLLRYHYDKWCHHKALQWKMNKEKSAYNIKWKALSLLPRIKKFSEQSQWSISYISHKWDHIIISIIILSIMISNECWHCYNHLHKQFFFHLPLFSNFDEKLMSAK